MKGRKESNVSFGEEGKETIATRLRSLIGTRSVRAAAQAWGLSFSTLNNYLTRGTEPPLNVALRIAEIENTSVEWIATGKKKATEETLQHSKMECTQNDTSALRAAWNVAFEYMPKDEAEELLRLLISGGARRIITIATQELTLEHAFHSLPTDLKERAIELIEAHIEAKKGASEGDKGNAVMSPDHKQAC